MKPIVPEEDNTKDHLFYKIASTEHRLPFKMRYGIFPVLGSLQYLSFILLGNAPFWITVVEESKPIACSCIYAFPSAPVYQLVFSSINDSEGDWHNFTDLYTCKHYDLRKCECIGRIPTSKQQRCWQHGDSTEPMKETDVKYLYCTVELILFLLFCKGLSSLTPGQNKLLMRECTGANLLFLQMYAEVLK